jgi:hypothetical protein
MLSSRSTHQMPSAHLNLEFAQQTMIRSRKSRARADLVAFPSVFLPSEGLCGAHPLECVRCSPNGLVLSLLQRVYISGQLDCICLTHTCWSLVHFLLKVSAPGYHKRNRALDSDSPTVQAHPALNPVLQALDRKKYVRAPRRVHDLFDIPRQCLVLRKNGSLECSPQSALQESSEKHLTLRNLLHERERYDKQMSSW